jgi:hypothetical protein
MLICYPAPTCSFGQLKSLTTSNFVDYVLYPEKLPQCFPSATSHEAPESYTNLAHVLPIQHTFSDGFSVGSYEITHPTGRLVVRYRMTTQPPEPPVLGQ